MVNGFQNWPNKGQAANPNAGHLEGVTLFKFEKNDSSEDILIAELDTIDEHHGPYSADPPYTVLEGIGVALTPKLKAVLAQLGFDTFRETAEVQRQPSVASEG